MSTQITDAAEAIAKQLEGVAHVTIMNGGFLVQTLPGVSDTKRDPEPASKLDEEHSEQAWQPVQQMDEDPAVSTAETPAVSHFPPQFTQSNVHIIMAALEVNGQLAPAIAMLQTVAGQLEAALAYQRRVLEAALPPQPFQGKAVYHVSQVESQPAVSTPANVQKVEPTVQKVEPTVQKVEPTPANVQKVEPTPANAPKVEPARAGKKAKDSEWLAVANSKKDTKVYKPASAPANAHATYRKVSSHDDSRANSRVTKAGAAGVDMPTPFVPQEGYVTGSALQSKGYKHPEVPKCTLKHSKDECDGEESWEQCVDIYGNKIPGAVSRTANKAAHRNDANTLKDAPTNANFCRNDGGSDIYTCSDESCTSNHVAKFLPKEKLATEKRPRGEGGRYVPRIAASTDSASSTDGNSRSGARNADGEAPKGITLGDRPITIKVRPATLAASKEATASKEDATPVERSVSPLPATMKKSIDGLPPALANKLNKSTEGKTEGKTE